MEALYEKTRYKGTTIIGLVVDNGNAIILASDKKTTNGNIVVRNEARKIHQIGKCIWLATAGVVSDIQKTVENVSIDYELNKVLYRELSVKAVVHSISNKFWNQNKSQVPLLTAIIVGGIDKDGPSLCEIVEDGAVLNHDAVALGSGSPIAGAVIEDRYTQEMSLNDGVELAVRAVYRATKKDTYSGCGIKVVAITQDGSMEIEQSIIEGLINGLKNQKRITKGKIKKLKKE